MLYNAILIIPFKLGALETIKENTPVYKDENQPSTFETTPTYVIISHSDNSVQIVGIGNDRQENIPMFEDVKLSETFKTTSTYFSELCSDNSVQTVVIAKDHQEHSPMFGEI